MSEKKKKKISASRLSALIENIKVEHDIPVLERIRYPIIWERTTNGYRVQDLQPSKIDNAVNIIKEYYLFEDTLCKGIGLVEDDRAVSEYLSLVATWLRDTQSLAAVEEGTGAIVGVLIGRVLDRTVRTQTRMASADKNNSQIDLGLQNDCPIPPSEETASRPTTATTKKSKTPKSKDTTETKISDRRSMKSTIQTPRLTMAEEEDETGVLGKILTPIFDDELTIVQNQKLQAIHKLKSHLTRNVDILSIYGVDMYYSIYIILVVPDHRDRGLAKALIRSCIEMSNKVGCDVVSGIFTSNVSQNIAYKEGFKIHDELQLSNWLTENDEEVFKEINGIEHSVAVMAHKKIIPEPPPPPVPLNPPRRSSRGARTR